MKLPLPITLTDQALSEIADTFKNKNIPEGYALRIGIKGGGCAGLGYILGFDKQKPNDDSYSVDGIPILIEKKHTMYLAGLQIDFVNNETERGFIFVNS